MKEIKLTKGKVALIDDGDYERVSQHNWQASRSLSKPSWRPRKWYAVRRIWLPELKTKETLFLHRFLLNPPDHLEVDHINGDSLDCRRSNMRLATPAQNRMNRGPQINSASGYKGVCQRGSRWEAQIRVNGKKLNLGCFSTPTEAARIYDQAARKHFGEFAYINLPDAPEGEKP